MKPKPTMTYLFHGPDQFRLKSEIEKITKEHLQEHGPQSVVFLECEATGSALDIDLQNELTGSSLFVKQKCIVLRDYLKKASKETLTFLELFVRKKTPHTIIFQETNIDQRKKVIKKIKKNGVVKKFEHYKPFELQNIAKEKFQNNNVSIEPRVLERIVFASENDIQKLTNDTEKLIAYSGEKGSINEKDVNDLVQFPLEDNIFAFSEDLANKNISKVLRFFKEQTTKENNAPYLVFMIARQFRNMLMVKVAGEQNLSDQEIIKKTKMHPYALTKTKQATRNFSLQELKMIFRQILLLDIAIKSQGDSQKSFEEFVIKIV